MGTNDPTGRGQFGPHGLDWQDLCRGPLNIAISSGPHGFSVEFFLKFFSHYKYGSS